MVCRIVLVLKPLIFQKRLVHHAPNQVLYPRLLAHHDPPGSTDRPESGRNPRKQRLLRSPGVEHTAGDGHGVNGVGLGPTMVSVPFFRRHGRTQEPDGPAMRSQLPDHGFMIVAGGFDARDDVGRPDLDAPGLRP